MWLLNTSTLKLKRISEPRGNPDNPFAPLEPDDPADPVDPDDSDDPREDYPENYAILSHRWFRKELTFDDISNPSSGYKSKRAYAKVKGACDRAKADGFKYIWMDTCCIDKKNTAEFFTSINSMYRYYQNAKRCYVYLHDVPPKEHPDKEAAFRKSQWFTRGWTLQELIAPSDVVFYDCDWALYGTKKGLTNEIAQITGICINVLNGDPPGIASIAQRMSWAANRKTTEKEDIAYCLLGIFDVNMLPLYGEGEKRAFIRLQEEILKRSDDQSLFAWTDSKASQYSLGSFNRDTDPDAAKGLLADSPRDFSGSHDISPFYRQHDSNPYLMTNKGLRIELPLKRPDKLEFLQTKMPRSKEIFTATLACSRESEPNKCIAIVLEALPHCTEQCVRIYPSRLVTIDKSLDWPSPAIYIREPFARSSFGEPSSYGFQIEIDVLKKNLILREAHPVIAWDRSTNSVWVTSKPGAAGAILHFYYKTHLSFGVVIGVSPSKPPGRPTSWCSAIKTSDDKNLKELFDSYESKLQKQDFGGDDKLWLTNKFFSNGLVEVKTTLTGRVGEPRFKLVVSVI